ncbi:MAG: hypothetical protein IJE08_09825 [Clostridia bacterium]|nr:hypothetical protein [Clostridia bacterium]
MACIISVDGGGSKLNAMMFDENMNLLGRGLSGGVNLTQTSLEDCRANVCDALDQLMKDGVPECVDILYITFVGPSKVFIEELEKRTKVGKVIGNGEAQAAILAGNLTMTGVVALSGTGADIFWLGENERKVVGAWGPILGDQGSGTWIGQTAIREVVKMINGWADDTVMLDLIMKEWNLEKPWDMVHKVHGAPAPFRQVASLTRVVGKAVEMGDKVAINIIKEAAHLLAVQTDSLFRQVGLTEEQQHITLCGGAWKTHPMMFEFYKEEMKAMYPKSTARRPMFEHVCAGPARYLLEELNMERSEALRLMREKLPQYRLDLDEKD